MEKDLISILLPVYNSEKYLRKCLDALKNQTYKNIEIICVNDGSKDSSYEILLEYQKLDNRFKVVFLGKNCPTYFKNSSVKTEAELVALSAVPFDEAQKIMASADVLINIGNSIPVHIPSKTFEYINMGKPFVNFYKFDECPTLYYTERYPLCLNLSEADEDIDSVAERFINFCVENKGKQLDQEWIMENYAESTPAVIAKQIDDALTELLKEKNKKSK